MPRWSLRVKLGLGLGLVVAMILVLLAGSIYGLHGFHASNLKLTDQLRELGASSDLLARVIELEAGSLESPAARAALRSRALRARDALALYWRQLRANATGARPDPRDEMEMAYRIDDDLTALLAQLSPGEHVAPLLPGTPKYIRQARDRAGAGAPLTPGARVERLNRNVLSLPASLHRDFYAILEQSRFQYESRSALAWVTAAAALALLVGLMVVVNRWILGPVRLLHRGVRRVAAGDFTSAIRVSTGDEMQALAEAFNEMTARLGATYHDLERQVEERSKQLVRSERLAGVGFLAAGVAHEINNPLASIAFGSEALERRLDGLLTAAPEAEARTAHQYLRMIQDEAFRCKRITEKLLDFSRCGEIQRQRTDLVGLVQAVVEMVQHMGKYRGKSILFQPRQAVLAHVDPQEIKQVVLNLVVNALDSMEPGGTLRITLRTDHGMAEMLFDDDGCGMEPEVLENIFEPFFTRRKVGKGTGLGLSISHRIVSQHAGEISASSPGPGKGSTFRVRLPLREGVPPSAASPNPEPAARARVA